MTLWAVCLLLCNTTAWPREPATFGAALRVLDGASTGRRILARARQALQVDNETGWEQVFQWGEVSRTDAVLTRHFNTTTGHESRIRKVTIYLKRGQGLEELVLDIAHELTHAAADPHWDPYDPELTAADYIAGALEAPGGEIDALVAECEVAFELQGELRGGWSSAARRCERYRNARGVPVDVDRARVQRDFYRIGRWRQSLAERLGKGIRRFPLLSADDPELYSSTGQAPYPVALLREFEEITRAACENSRRRLSQSSSRTPASGTTSAPPVAPALEGAARFLVRRCQEGG